MSQGFTRWSRFHHLVESRGQSWSGANGALGRANARYRASFCLRIRFDDLDGSYKTQETVEGYGFLVGAALSYSSLDALEKGIRKHVKEFQSPSPGPVVVRSADLANRFRSADLKRLRDALLRDVNEKLRRKLISLHEGRSKDVTPLAEAMRHLVFHGVFAPGTIGLKYRPVLDLLDGLRDETHRAADLHFTQWVDRL